MRPIPGFVEVVDVWLHADGWKYLINAATTSRPLQTLYRSMHETLTCFLSKAKPKLPDIQSVTRVPSAHWMQT